jgi:hypothetical protein
MDKYTMMQRDVNIYQIIYFKVNFKSMITVCVTYENICNLGYNVLKQIPHWVLPKSQNASVSATQNKTTSAEVLSSKTISNAGVVV